MVLPFVEVSHLAASSSFYATILQPLGLRYLGTSRDHTSSVGTITFGIPEAKLPGAVKRRQAGQSQGQNGGQEPISLPVLQIREGTHPFEPLKISTLVLGAPSPDAIIDFHDAALTANPWLAVQTDGDPIYPGGPSPMPGLGIEAGEIPRRATIRDLDGNTIQVVYLDIPNPTSRDNFGRILDWTYDGATAKRSSHTRSRSKSQPHINSSARSSSSSLSTVQSPFQPLQQPGARPSSSTVTAAEMTYRAASRGSDAADEVSVSPRQSSNINGLSTTTVVGALLGVAGAAAITYGIVNNVGKDRERRPRQDFEPPSLPRRSTFPEKAHTVHNVRHNERRSTYGDYPPKSLAHRPPPIAYNPEPDYPEGFPIRQIPQQNGYIPRKMSRPADFPSQKLGLVDEDSSSDDSQPSPPRTVQYLTEAPHTEKTRSVVTRERGRGGSSSSSESGGGNSTDRSRSRSRSRARSKARSTAKSMARSTARSTVKSTTSRTAKSTTRSTVKSTARSTGRSARSVAKSTTRNLVRSPSRAPDDQYEAVHSRGMDEYENTPGRVPDGYESPRSRHSSRHRSRRTSAPRARSEAPISKKSAAMADGDHRSHAGSRHTTAPKSTYSMARSHRPDYDERETYYSTRSRPSSRAPRHPPPPHVETEIFEAPDVPDEPHILHVPRISPMHHDLGMPEAPEVPEVPDMPDMAELHNMMARSHAGTRFSVPRTTTGPDFPGHGGFASKAQSFASARKMPLPVSRVESLASARQVSLPMSGVGSSHAAWDDDDVASVAPSDSISCVGSKMSRRSRKVR